jgi:hypothetical protein
VIAWALTDNMPETNVPLLPAPGPWRNIARAATQHDPGRRPQSIHALKDLIDREFTEIPQPPAERAEDLLPAAQAGDQNAVEALLSLVADHRDDYPLYLSVLAKLPAAQACPALSSNPHRATTLIQAMADHADGTNFVQFGEAATAVIWLHEIAAYAAGRQEWDLLEEAVRSMCRWDGIWDQWHAQGKVQPWLRTLDGGAADVVAAALRDHPASAMHFAHLADDRQVHLRIREAVRAASPPS